MKPRLIWMSALLLAAACKGEKEGGEKTVKAVVAAHTVAAATEPFTHIVTGMGSVITRPDHFAALSAPSPTRIAKVHVAAGDRVAAGAPLVEFDQVAFNAAASGAEAALVAAQKTFERAQRLAGEGIIPRKDVEQATADLAKARVDAVTTHRAQQLSILRSPVTGVVTRMTAVLGAPADAGQVLVEIADPSTFDVVLSLGPSEAASVLPGARVRLFAGEKRGEATLADGRVTSVAAVVDSVTRAIAVRVGISAPHRALRLGESVFGEIAVGTRSSVVIPIEALLPGDEVGTYKVFVVDAKGTALAREVKVGGRTEAKAEILEGLKNGEMVVSQGAFAVGDSAQVAKPVPVKP